MTLDDLLAHAEWVRALSRHLASDEDAAEEVEQETWVAAVRRPPAAGGNLRAWFARVVRRRTSDRRRESWRRTRREAVAFARRPPSGGDDVVARAESRAQVAGAVLSLAEPYRSTVLLRYFEDQDVDAIATLHAVPVATVRTRLRRGRALLRERLAVVWRTDERGVRRHALALAGIGAPNALLLSAKAKAASLLAAAALAAGSLAWVLSRERAPDPGGASAPTVAEPRVEPRLLAHAGPERAPPPALAAERDDGLFAYPALARGPARLEGVVLDARGRPAAGATVEARSTSGAEHPLLRVRDDRGHRRTTTTDAQGAFRFEDLSAGPYALQARLGDERSSWREVVARDAAGQVDLALSELPASERLAFRVVDASGAPVEGASVRAETSGGRTLLVPGALLAVYEASTGADGRVAWPHVPSPGARATARALDGRIGVAVVRDRTLVGHSGAETPIVVAEPGRLRGRVSTDSGEAAEGLRVEARWAGANPYWAPPSSSWRSPVVGGAYEIVGLAAGSYHVTVVGGGWGQSVPWREDDRYPDRVSVEVEAGRTATADLVATRGATVEGTVLGPGGPVRGAWVRAVRDPRTGNEPDGVHLAGAHVWRLDSAHAPLPDHPLTHRTVSVDEAGRYRIDGLHPGPYRLEFTAPGHTLVQRLQQPAAVGAPLRVDVRLVPAGVLQGAVPGTSYLGARRVGEEGCRAVAILPSSGLFTFPGLEPGDYDLVSVYWGWETKVLASARVEAGRTTWVDLWNAGEHGVDGRLLLGGKALPDATVGRGWGEDAVRADADGSFALRWARSGGSATFHVSRRLEDGGVQTWKVEGLPVTGEGTTRLPDLEVGRERLVVDVRDATGGPAGAVVVVTPEPEGAPGRGGGNRPGGKARTGDATDGGRPLVASSFRGPTDASGRLDVDGWPAGTYRVEARVSPVLVLRTRATLPSEGPVRLVAPRTARLAITVRTASGAPATDAHASVRTWSDRVEAPEDASGSEWEDASLYVAAAQADVDGRIVLDGLAAGALHVYAAQSGAAPFGARRAMVSTRLFLAPGESREVELRYP